jgi:precorrin-2/cobalt-factor-2 C20-methyltransferase
MNYDTRNGSVIWVRNRTRRPRIVDAKSLSNSTIGACDCLPDNGEWQSVGTGDRGRFAAENLAEHLSAGRDVAVLCEGEPFLYGSFMYLFNRLSTKFHTEVVPGISSTMASASALGVPLTYRNDVLSIMPATLDADILRDRLAVADAAVIIKLGRHFSKVREVLSALGLLSRSLYIERATMPNQRIIPISDVDAAEVPYWALIVVPSLQTSVT